MQNGVRAILGRVGLGRARGSDGDPRESPAVPAMALGLFIATAALVWFGYVAAREWRRGTDLLYERLAAEVLALADVELARDMKGAWINLIVPVNPLAISESPPYDLLQQTQQTFARFPYPESFIVWKDTGEGRTYVFNRAERKPGWDNSERTDDPFPVVMVEDPPALRPLVEMARQRARDGKPYSMFDIDIGSARYQVVAHLMFSSNRSATLTGFAAFTINLSWVRQEYFPPLIGQVAQIGGRGGGITLSVFDESGQLVATTNPAGRGTWEAHRTFPLVFLEPAVITSPDPHDLHVPKWTLRVTSSRTDVGSAGFDAANRIFGLMVVAAIASTTALFQTVRAVRASARLAAMKSEFVAAVTHELKTPLALIRLVGDTLAQRRYSSPEVIQEYASLLSQETVRLSQSIDHLLLFARYTDGAAKQAHDFARHDVADLVEDALERFRPALIELGFEVTIDVPRGLPRVSVDGRGIGQALEIVIDNAIKYSGETRVLALAGEQKGQFVRVTVTDRGIGVAAGDLHHIFDRFYRGGNAKGSGSGLGLAIARRILRHNGGEIHITSTLNVGTEVACLLPLAG